VSPSHADTTAIALLEETLKSQSNRGDFDMNDGPELEALKPFPRLSEALIWLGKNVAEPWQRADAAAMVHQTRHGKLARTAIATGTGAIILAILQLALKLSWPGLVGPLFWLEVVTVLGGVVAVIVGLWAKADRNWLGERHRAERLRMLKFRALIHPLLWSGKTDEWRAWVQSRFQELNGAGEFERIEDWSRGDQPEPAQPHISGRLEASDDTAALVMYYRCKRLANQRDYFERKGVQAKAQAAWQHQLRLPLFFVTLGCVLFHFGADWLSIRMSHAGNHEAAHLWELASLWGVVLAAVLPVYGVGVRAWTSAFEHARKARSFAAKRVAMDQAIDRLDQEKGDLAAILDHTQHDELFLEQEHREWLRLLLDAEWFL
jgi:hypothetical protein